LEDTMTDEEIHTEDLVDITIPTEEIDAAIKANKKGKRVKLVLAILIAIPVLSCLFAIFTQ